MRTRKEIEKRIDEGKYKYIMFPEDDFIETEKMKNDCITLIDNEIEQYGCILESKDDFIYSKDITCFLTDAVLKSIDINSVYADLVCRDYVVYLYDKIVSILEKKYKTVSDEKNIYFYDNQYNFSNTKELEQALGLDLDYAFEKAREEKNK